jgi:hypothetical protein
MRWQKLPGFREEVRRIARDYFRDEYSDIMYALLKTAKQPGAGAGAGAGVTAGHLILQMLGELEPPTGCPLGEIQNPKSLCSFHAHFPMLTFRPSQAKNPRKMSKMSTPKVTLMSTTPISNPKSGALRGRRFCRG